MKRARFSSLVPRDIWNAINNLVAPNPHENDAVDARQEIDLRIGAAFTRFQTIRVQNNAGVESVVSYGPCQFPTLGFVVEAWQRREAFEPEPFWTIKVEVTTKNQNESGEVSKLSTNQKAKGKYKGNPSDYAEQTERATFNWCRGHLFDRTATLILYEMCISAPIAVVERVEKREKLVLILLIFFF